MKKYDIATTVTPSSPEKISLFINGKAWANWTDIDIKLSYDFRIGSYNTSRGFEC